jgi:hypothetical protein
LPSHRRESWNVQSVRGSGFFRQFLVREQDRPIAAPYSRRDRSRFGKRVHGSPHFVHYPFPRFRGRDSRSQPYKSLTLDQRCLSDLILLLELRCTCTMACDRDVRNALNVGTTPIFGLSPNDREVSGEASTYFQLPTTHRDASRRNLEVSTHSGISGRETTSPCI